MKNLSVALVGMLFSATGALAQSEITRTTESTPAVSTSGETNPSAPVAGENSFTEEQAKSRIEEAGYTDVSSLKLDDQGVWRAMAKKDGKQGHVSLDFQGNIVATD